MIARFRKAVMRCGIAISTTIKEMNKPGLQLQAFSRKARSSKRL
jgi:hypothetical protein